MSADENYRSKDFWKEQERITEEERLMDKIAEEDKQ